MILMFGMQLIKKDCQEIMLPGNQFYPEWRENFSYVFYMNL